MRKGRIFYYCYRHNKPTGGQKHTYRHVDILNQYGFDAAAFHPGRAFRLTWFENNTRVISYSQFARSFDSDLDFVVLPEDLGLEICAFPGRKVIFNKNIFYGFRCYGTSRCTSYPYQSPDVIAALTVSEHNRAHLQFAYPHLLVERVYLEIQPDIFRFSRLRDKKAQIACVQKAPESLLSLYHTVQSRSLSGLNNAGIFNWEFLGEKSETKTALILRESLLFVFLSVAEGLGRMPLEAMASGCLVAAYGNGPLHETIPRIYTFEHSNIIALATFVETVMNSFPDRLDQWEPAVKAGLQIAQGFSAQRQERSVLDAWEKICTLGRKQTQRGKSLQD
jgi:Glycosyl transferases group 1